MILVHIINLFDRSTYLIRENETFKISLKYQKSFSLVYHLVKKVMQSWQVNSKRHLEILFLYWTANVISRFSHIKFDQIRLTISHAHLSKKSRSFHDYCSSFNELSSTLGYITHEWQDHCSVSNRICSHSSKRVIIHNISRNRGSVAGSVIQATGTVEFEDALRTGDLHGGCWCPWGGRTYPRINTKPPWGCRLVLEAVWLSDRIPNLLSSAHRWC